VSEVGAEKDGGGGKLSRNEKMFSSGRRDVEAAPRHTVLEMGSRATEHEAGEDGDEMVWGTRW
jgi:hypothetical protein